MPWKMVGTAQGRLCPPYNAGVARDGGEVGKGFVIASAAKQSILPLLGDMDCFAALAMTAKSHTAISCASPARLAFFGFDGSNRQPAANPAVSATPGLRETIAATMAPSINSAS